MNPANDETAYLRTELRRKDDEERERIHLRIERLERSQAEGFSMLSTKIDDRCASKADLTDIESITQDHETRLRVLERDGWIRHGFAAAIGFVSGLFGGKITGGGS